MLVMRVMLMPIGLHGHQRLYQLGTADRAGRQRELVSSADQHEAIGNQRTQQHAAEGEARSELAPAKAPFAICNHSRTWLNSRASRLSRLSSIGTFSLSAPASPSRACCSSVLHNFDRLLPPT